MLQMLASGGLLTVESRLRGRCLSCGLVLKIRCAALVLHHSGLWFQTHGALVGLGLAFGNLADVAIVAGLALALWPRG
jgi:hypothetical protein